MHQRTYERIIREVEALDSLTQARMATISSQMEKRLPKELRMLVVLD
jgi:hypothetical protein